MDGQLTFALKNEGLDLVVLKRLFVATGPGPVEAIVRAKTDGLLCARIWFLYEWLTGQRLDLPDADRGAYPACRRSGPGICGGRRDLLPASREEQSARHAGFLPPGVFGRDELERFVGMDLPAGARHAAAAVPRDPLARTAAFLLLNDSRSSFAIEGERLRPDRIQRWGRAIDGYRAALEDYSRRLLPAVDWGPTDNGNVRVLNDTGDFYRFFDATPQTEFLYGCVQRTIEQDLPEEAAFLKRYDAFRAELNLMLDLPDRLSDLLFRFLQQNAESCPAAPGRRNSQP